MRPNAPIMSAAILFAACAPMARAADPAPDLLAQVVPSALNGGASGTASTPEAIQVNGQAGTGDQGQSERPGQNTSGDQTSKTVSLPTSPPPQIGLFPEFGATLLSDGIDVHGIAFDHFLANPTAGVDTKNTTNLGAFRPVADFDLGKLIGLTGGNIHFAMTIFGLRSDVPQAITNAGGVLDGFQTTPATQTNIVSLFTYEQRLLDNKLSIQFGRTNAYNYFLLPNSFDPFSYYSTSFQVNGDFASTPYPVWGGVATYRYAPTWYVQGGLFEDNYRYTTGYGDRLGDGLATGVQALGEIGHRSEFSNAQYPSNLEVGIEWNTRHGRSNLKGTGAPAIPLLQVANYPGGGVLFLQGEQVVWRGPKRAFGPPANVAVYGSFDPSLDKPQPLDLDAMVGVNLTGFIPGRPFDALGLQTRYQRLSQVEALGETRREDFFALITRNAENRHFVQSRNGFSFEAVGNIQVTPAIAFRPIVEYFVNPDNYYPPAVHPNVPHDGIEAGFFAVVSLGRLLGTSLKPF